MLSLKSLFEVQDKMEKSDIQVEPERCNYDEDKQESFDEERYSAMPTVDLCDLTFSSFNDILLGDCSYFMDDSVSDSGNIVEKVADTKQSQKIINSVIREDSEIGESQSDSGKQKIDNLINNNNYNFYHVFEVIEKPVIKDGQTQTNTLSTMKCKSHKSSKHKKKKKVMAGSIRKGQRYLPNFKQKVLDYASSHTFKATALHFNINCNTITEWTRERKRLSLQEKNTSDSVCQYKTEIVHTPPTKTDIVNLNDKITTETEFNDNVLKKIEQDLPIGDMRSDERFLKWIMNMRNEKRELSKNEVYHAAECCLKSFKSNVKHPLWFELWFKRYDKALWNLDKSDHETEKHIMYPNNFKLEVALYAKLFTKNSAARVFNVPRRRIFDWFKYSDSANINGSIDSSSSSSSSSTALEVTKYMEKDNSKKQIYGELHNWYKKKYSEGFSPNSNEIKAKARELFNANGIGNIKFSEGWLQKFCKRLNIKLRHNGDDHLLLWILAQFDNNVSLSHQEITEKSSKLIGKRKDFKGSKGWTLRFLKRHSNFLQKVPTIEDKLPDIIQNDINKFINNFRYTLDIHKLNMGSIGCMDEIPISFNYPQDGKAMNLPLLRKTGFESCQAVVFLCMLANGRILPPAVVIRGEGQRKILFDGNIPVFYHEKGVIDLDIVESWLEIVWLSCVPSPSILIADSFKPHASREITERLTKENSMISIIPEGCSSQLQPLDIEITPKFKELIKNEWMELPTNENPYGSKIIKGCRCPDPDTILLWIRNAYRKIEENPYSIMNSFKVVGLID